MVYYKLNIQLSLFLIECEDNEMPCPDLDYVCISAEHFCDGVPDCPNGGDEKPETCGMCNTIMYTCSAPYNDIIY